MTSKIATILVDPSSLFRDGLGRLLAETPFDIVARVASFCELQGVQAPAGEQVLVIADFGSDAETVRDRVQTVKSSHSKVKVLVLSDRYDVRHLAAAIAGGADGYQVKTIGCDVLVKSMELVMLGIPVFPAAVRDTMLELDGGGDPVGTGRIKVPRHLSGRETEILERIVRGDANKVIAMELGITESTVKVHVKAILRKIRVRNRTQAAIWALDHGAVAANEDKRLEASKEEVLSVDGAIPEAMSNESPLHPPQEAWFRRDRDRVPKGAMAGR